MTLTFAYYLDADKDVERALQHDLAEEAARRSQAIEAANRVIESWVLRSGGRILNEDGTKGSAEIPAECLEDLPDIIRQVEEATDARLHVGVGAETSEAMAALKVAEKRGKPTLYTPDISDEAAEESDEDPLNLEDMSKAQFNEPAPAGEATQIQQGALSPTAAAPSPPPSASYGAPQQPGQAAQQPAGAPPPGGPENEDQLIQAIGGVLQDMKAQLPFFEQQVKGANPQAYQAVMGLVEAMVALARQVTGGGPDQPHPDEGQQPPQESQPQVDKGAETKKSETMTVCKKHYKPHIKGGQCPECMDEEDEDSSKMEESLLGLEKVAKEEDLAAIYGRMKPKERQRLADRMAQYQQATGDTSAVLARHLAAAAGKPIPPPVAKAEGGRPKCKCGQPKTTGAKMCDRCTQTDADTWRDSRRDERIDRPEEYEKAEAEKVEREPGDPVIPEGKLRKLFEEAKKACEKGEMADGGAPVWDLDYQEYSRGFHHESKEHPHLNDHQAAATAIQHLREDPKYYTKLLSLERTGMLGKAEDLFADDELPHTNQVSREALDPASWHIRYKHGPQPGITSEHFSYLNRKGKYTATPSPRTQYKSSEVALQHLREVAKRHGQAESAYTVHQGVGEIFKREVAAHAAHKYPVGTQYKGRVKVVEPVTGKTSWHSARAGQKLSGDGHAVSARLAECPSASTPENPTPGQGPSTAQRDPTMSDAGKGPQKR